MEYDYLREAARIAELKEELAAALQALNIEPAPAHATASGMLEAFVTSTPPETPPEASPGNVGLVVIGLMGDGGGSSTKAGNLRFDLGRLMEALACSTLTIVGAVQMPLVMPLAALLVWRSLRRAAAVEISELEAGVLYTLWVHKDGGRNVPNEGLLDKCNALLAKYGKPSITQAALTRALRNLERIDTIKKSARRHDAWWLREWIRVKYR